MIDTHIPIKMSCLVIWLSFVLSFLFWLWSGALEIPRLMTQLVERHGLERLDLQQVERLNFEISNCFTLHLGVIKTYRIFFLLLRQEYFLSLSYFHVPLTHFRYNLHNYLLAIFKK